MLRFNHIIFSVYMLRNEIFQNIKRSQAMGLNIMMLRLIGSIPGPIIGGKLIDTTCIAWQEDCGSTGNCRLYDRHSLAMTWFGLHMVRFIYES